MPKFNYEAVKDILRCPNSLTPLVPDGESLVCVDPECRLQYSILDGIPNLLVDDGMQLSTDAWQRAMHQHAQQPPEASPNDQSPTDNT